MATLVEYLDFSDLSASCTFEPKRKTVGYITPAPQEALRQLLPRYHVVNYLGINIPSRNEFSNLNNGLGISYIDDGPGLIGDVGVLNASELFRRCRRDSYTDEERQDIANSLKDGIVGFCRDEPLMLDDADKYSVILDVLGHPLSRDEIIKLSTPKDYGKPIVMEKGFFGTPESGQDFFPIGYTQIGSSL